MSYTPGSMGSGPFKEMKNAIDFDGEPFNAPLESFPSCPDISVALPAESCFILDGLVEGFVRAEQQLAQHKDRVKAYIVQQAKVLGVNDPSYTFDPDTRTFKATPHP